MHSSACAHKNRNSVSIGLVRYELCALPDKPQCCGYQLFCSPVPANGSTLRVNMCLFQRALLSAICRITERRVSRCLTPIDYACNH